MSNSPFFKPATAENIEARQELLLKDLKGHYQPLDFEWGEIRLLTKEDIKHFFWAHNMRVVGIDEDNITHSVCIHIDCWYSENARPSLDQVVSEFKDRAMMTVRYSFLFYMLRYNTANPPDQLIIYS